MAKRKKTRDQQTVQEDAIGKRNKKVAVAAVMIGSVTKRLLCIPVQSTYKCTTRGEERGTGLQEVKPIRTSRNHFHSTMRSHAPSKPCLIATLLLRFRTTMREAFTCRQCISLTMPAKSAIVALSY